jgi:hypothetical protein
MNMWTTIYTNISMINNNFFNNFQKSTLFFKKINYIKMISYFLIDQLILSKVEGNECEYEYFNTQMVRVWYGYKYCYTREYESKFMKHRHSLD